jgi:hypothetical protein
VDTPAKVNSEKRGEKCRQQKEALLGYYRHDAGVIVAASLLAAKKATVLQGKPASRLAATIAPRCGSRISCRQLSVECLPLNVGR